MAVEIMQMKFMQMNIRLSRLWSLRPWVACLGKQEGAGQLLVSGQRDQWSRPYTPILECVPRGFPNCLPFRLNPNSTSNPRPRVSQEQLCRHRV